MSEPTFLDMVRSSSVRCESSHQDVEILRVSGGSGRTESAGKKSAEKRQHRTVQRTVPNARREGLMAPS
jgi:hypothetical protein